MTVESKANAARARRAQSERTRAALCEGARQVFARVGYFDATVTDITTAANVAHGTFYTHFASKEEVLAEVLRSVHEHAFEVTTRRASDGAARDRSPQDRIAAANRGFLDSYRDNAAVLALLEQVASFKPEFAELRAETRRAYVNRTAGAIRRWQATGLVRPDVDAEACAELLGCMVERYAYMHHVFGEGCDDRERGLAALNDIWLSALGLERAPGDVAVR